MKNNLSSFLLISVVAGILACQPATSEQAETDKIADEIEQSLKNNLLDTWYPKAIDKEYGGYYSNFTSDFQVKEQQVKMIVTQSRHLWSNAKAAIRYPEDQHFLVGARHGLAFLKDKMWDKEHGGFYNLVDREGNPLLEREPLKTAYGNSFGIYSLAAYFQATRDSAGLQLAIKAFNWLEEHSYDSVNGGYFQHLQQDGTPAQRGQEVASTSDLGYKDQNSSIHLLEAFSELYTVWKDPLLKQRLEEMLLLVRDKITNEQGNLVLFFERDWRPVSFQSETREVILEHRNLDHVSFGHDVETAYLMIEASHILGHEHDSTTLYTAKKMVDQALELGWDEENGGFYDEGYYFQGSDSLEIIKDTKNWWAQAEGMNSLLLMSRLFPDDEKDYYGKFEKLWNYIDNNLIDHENGDWYSGGLDKQPNLKTADKGNIWKANYHQFRSMANVVDMLRGKSDLI